MYLATWIGLTIFSRPFRVTSSCTSEASTGFSLSLMHLFSSTFSFLTWFPFLQWSLLFRFLLIDYPLNFWSYLPYKSRNTNSWGLDTMSIPTSNLAQNLHNFVIKSIGTLVSRSIATVLHWYVLSHEKKSTRSMVW